MKRLASTLLIFAALLQADFQPSAWKYRRAISATPGAAMDALTVDRTTYIHAQPGLADLRVMRGTEEIPYVLEKSAGSHDYREVAGGVLDLGVSPAGNLEFVVDVGKDRNTSTPRHNGIRIETPRTNYRQRVDIFTSDDRRTWTLVRQNAYIFDFSQDARHVFVRRVSYPVSTRRYLRVTVYGWNDPKSVTECFVTSEENATPERDTMATLRADAQEDTKTQSTLFTWDLGVAGIPFDQMTLDVETQAFQRAAVVETSKDGKEWFAAGQGVLSRFANEMPVRLDFPESHERYVRLRVYNRDDHPLQVKSAALSVVRSRVKFKAAAPGSYWLYYGNTDAAAPSYDLHSLLAHGALMPETVVEAGVEESNPDHREKAPPAKPWTEQHPAILYVTLALAVLVMGVVTVRFFNKVAADNR